MLYKFDILNAGVLQFLNLSLVRMFVKLVYYIQTFCNIFCEEPARVKLLFSFRFDNNLRFDSVVEETHHKGKLDRKIA